MTKRYALVALVALVAALAVRPAAASVDCTVREGNLPHECDGGANDGLTCTPDFSNIPDPLTCSASRDAENNGCPGGSCAITFVPGRSATFKGILSIVVDENVSRLDGQAPAVVNVVAATLVFDLGKLGTLAQTYQAIDVNDLQALTVPPTDEFGVPASKFALQNQATEVDGQARVVKDLVFRSNEPEMASALRTLLGLAGGTPVVTKVSSVKFTGRSDGLASVLRMKVKGAFVEP